MKYRTIIEIISEASSKEDAFNTAGEYLKGDVDFGVQMKCRTLPLWSHRVRKYSAVCAVMFVVFSALFLRSSLIVEYDKESGSPQVSFSNAYTIQPELKTKHESDFKKEWENKKDKAVLDFIKE